MDITKHIEVVSKAIYGEYTKPSPPDGPNHAVRAIRALEAAGLLRAPGSDYCTPAERELIEAWVETETTGHYGERWPTARKRLLAERAGKPVKPAPSEPTMVEGVRRWVAHEVERMNAMHAPQVPDMLATIATLREQLAEATRPRKLWHEVERRNDCEWVVWRCTEDRRWTSCTIKERVCGFEIGAHPNAEQHARAHAAKLDAEQGGGV